jgi:hypothetical protein
MIKKIFTCLILTLFTTTLVAEELFMKCDEFYYKYVQDPSGDKVFARHPIDTENKYEEWCTQAPSKTANKFGVLAKEGWVRIVKDNKATCLTKKVTYHNTAEVRTNTVSVSDFAKLTRYIEWYSTSTGSKKNIKNITCEKTND